MVNTRRQKIISPAFITLSGILIIFFLPHSGIGPFPFFYVLPVLLITWLLLKLQKENFSTLGFSFKRFEFKAVRAGAVAAIALFLFLQYIFFPVLEKFVVLKEANLDDFKNIRHHFPAYLFILLMGWVAGGFYEELVFHGFIFKGIEKIFSNKSGLFIPFLLTNIIFGVYHFQLGITGMINAFIAGCAYHVLMIKFQRNLWYSIFFHAFYDTIALTYIYLGYW